MMPTVISEQAQLPPPAYHRAQARLGPALHIDALTLVRTLHLLVFCRLAGRLAHRRCPPPLPAGPGGAPRTYSEESLLLLALLRTLWRLSYQDLHDWFEAWPALALACGLPLGHDGRPRISSLSHQCKRGQAAGAPPPEALFILSVLPALRRRLIGARDLIIDSAPSWPGIAPTPMPLIAHALTQHPWPLLRGYRVHTLLCRGSGLPICFLLSQALVHDAPFARPLLEWAVRFYSIRPRIIHLDAAYWGLRLIAWIHASLQAVAVIPWNRHPPEEPFLLATYLDQRGTRQAQFDRTFLWPGLLVLSRGLARPCVAGQPSHDRLRFPYTASIIVGLAAKPAGREWRGLAHCWEA
jgi:hypothetical protein